jgi:putative transposase
MSEGERIRRRRLPHWDVAHATYFVTTCLAGSIAATGRIDLVAYREELRRRPRDASLTNADAAIRDWKLIFARTDRWLDEDPAVHWFDSPELAKIAVDALYHFAGHQYELLGFVVMPSHMHWVFRPLPEWVATLDDPMLARRTICKSRNQWIARECNRALRRTKQFWQHESYDHWVRDADELERILLYIEANPVKARLVVSPEQYCFSSAFDRRKRALELGEALRREA